MTIADKTRKNIHALLSAALETAVRERHVKENVHTGVRAPRLAVRSRESVFLANADVALIAETIDRDTPSSRFFAATGLRFSKATAVRRRDIRQDDAGLGYTRQADKLPTPYPKCNTVGLVSLGGNRAVIECQA